MRVPGLTRILPQKWTLVVRVLWMGRACHRPHHDDRRRCGGPTAPPPCGCFDDAVLAVVALASGEEEESVDGSFLVLAELETASWKCRGWASKCTY